MGSRLRREQRALLPARVHESGFRLEWMEDPWEDVAAAGQWLLALEEEERPDVVHLCSYAHGALPFQAPKVLVAHSCVLSWWRAVHETEAPAQWDRYREEMAAGLAGADAIVAPTQAMLRELEHDNELPPGTAIVIYNGSSAPLATPRTEKRELIIGSGQVSDPARNLAMLDAAAEGLAWPVEVAGELRRGAQIYAAPAVYEPSGLGIIEAARDRCALVLGYIPSLRELWKDAAIFVEPRDEHALHEVLGALAADRYLRADLAERAQRRATTYSIAYTARAYHHLYEQLTGSKVPVSAPSNGQEPVRYSLDEGARVH